MKNTAIVKKHGKHGNWRKTRKTRLPCFRDFLLSLVILCVQVWIAEIQFLLIGFELVTQGLHTRIL